jgi:diguanylate cyclase (GGDEF)-like protein
VSALIPGVRAVVRPVVRLLVPEGALLFLLLLLPLAPFFGRLEPFTPLLLAGGAATAAAVGWRFRRAHLLYGVALTVGAVSLPYLPEPAGTLAAPLLLLDMALLAGLQERGPAAPRAFVFGLGVIAQAGLLLWLTANGLAMAPPPIPGLASLSMAEIAPGAALAVLALLALARSDAVLHGLLWSAVAILLLSLGSTAALPGPGSWPALAGVTILLVAGLEEAHRLAYHDALTGLPSRRALDERLERSLGTYTVAMVDVDHFKRINDRHGHDIGDQVLRMVATRLRGTPGARVYRYGGEEFTLVFPGKELEEVRHVLESVRERIADPPFVIRGSDRPRDVPERKLFLWRERQELKVTVSLGAAQRTGWRRSPDDVVREADQALYKAKKRGRNRVVA